MKIKIIFFINLIGSVFLSGCATTTPLSAANKNSIHTIRIDNNVVVPKQMYFMGDGNQLAMLFPGGLVGGAIAGAADTSKAAKIQKFAESNHIYIDQIVKDQFIKQIRENTNFRIVNSSTADATLKIAISEYGLSVPTTYSFSLTPVLGLKASLIKDNQIVWKSFYYLDPLFGGLPKYKSQDIETNPNTLSQAYNLAAEKAVAHIVKTIQ